MPDKRQDQIDEASSIASNDTILGWDTSAGTDIEIPISLLDARFAASGSGGSSEGSGNIDGGTPDSEYGGTEPLDGGTP